MAARLIPSSAMFLTPFDLVCVSGVGRVSKAIKWATTLPGEAATDISHVGFIIRSGSLYGATIQEALLDRGRVVRRALGEYAGTDCKVAIWRPTNLTDQDICDMRVRADETNGSRYGYFNILLHLIDSLATKTVRRRVRFARRFASRRWAECSANVADVWAMAGLTFGVETGTASPDDIADFCIRHPDKYELVRGLRPIPTPLTKDFVRGG